MVDFGRRMRHGFLLGQGRGGLKRVGAKVTHRKGRDVEIVRALMSKVKVDPRMLLSLKKPSRSLSPTSTSSLLRTTPHHSSLHLTSSAIMNPIPIPKMHQTSGISAYRSSHPSPSHPSQSRTRGALNPVELAAIPHPTHAYMHPVPLTNTVKLKQKARELFAHPSTRHGHHTAAA